MDNILEYPSCQDFSELIISIPKAIAKHWLSRLSHAEINVLLFIFGRTVVYRKSSEAIPYRHFEEGVFSSGKEVCCGAGIARRSIPNVIKSLEEKGLIKVIKQGVKGLAASVYAIDFKTLLAAAMDKLHISKKRNIVVNRNSNNENEASLQRILVVQTGHDEVDRKLKPKNLVSSLRSDAGQGRVRLRLSKRTARPCSTEDVSPTPQTPLPAPQAPATLADIAQLAAKRKPIVVKDIVSLWRKVYTEKRPNTPCPIITDDVRKKVKRVVGANFGSSNLEEVFAWVIDEWDWLRTSKLAWVAEKGYSVQVTKYPSLSSLVTYAKHFASAYLDRTTKPIVYTPVVTADPVKADLAELEKRVASLMRDNRILVSQVAAVEKQKRVREVQARIVSSSSNAHFKEWGDE